MNDASDFFHLQGRIISGMSQLNFSVERQLDDFLQRTVREILQVDFVNDVPAYIGETVDTSLLCKLDNPRISWLINYVR